MSTSTPVQRFDSIVVGGGPAGLSCAYALAKKGIRVVVLERGRTPGAKNLFGGRIYSSTLEKVYPNFRKEAPIERWVKHERLSLLSDEGALSVGYDSTGSTSFITHLPKLVAWMASKAEAEGAVIVSDVRVDEVLMSKGRAVGVRAGEDRVEGDVVVIAEGANRLLCEGMGIVPPLSADQVALGVRQVVRLGSEKVNERFGMAGDEGMAWFFIGKPSSYLPGGAFLYTSSSTVSIGLVLYLDKGMHSSDQDAYRILDRFRTSPPVGPLLEGGTVVEYGSHLIPEAGLGMMPRRLYGDGYLVAGDAAGLVLNLGYTVRGIDFAVQSGQLAAQTITEAHSSKDFTAAGLSHYGAKLNASFVVREMKRHQAVQKLMRKRQVFEAYPRILVDAARRLYEFDETSPLLLEAGRRSIKGRRSTIGVLGDLLTLARGP